MKRQVIAAVFASLLTNPVSAQNCGGNFASFVENLRQESMDRGYSPRTVSEFFDGVAQDPDVIRADRSQGVFQLPFVEFARRLISQNRIEQGEKNRTRYREIFDRIEREYGIPAGVLLAFWAFETDYGAFQGDFNTLNALTTLSHDCRRPALFRPQIFAALALYARGEFDPDTTTGAWAGEIGMVQMLPGDILENGVDGDGDGRVALKTSAPDALMSAANMLTHLGWQANRPWLQEITLPADFDWSATGLDKKKSVSQWAGIGARPRAGDWADSGAEASIIIPQGRSGPAFITYPNFDVYFEWNQSFVYVTTAAYFATRLEGAPVFNAGQPEGGLDDTQMKLLQRKLQARGYDVGEVDGILGANTRKAVQAEQKRLGLPADAWPTLTLLNQL
ncbi:MAG: lytic murein transglycosylase [Paracoccaceae bacterium]|jgi:lytic murein transglycosylase|nr:lytic murein transglycosylase [Paracoccaceae bacterium]MDP7185670.1 lytic murein transglycosylase [Paracoccaceae bacterium]